MKLLLATLFGTAMLLAMPGYGADAGELKARLGAASKLFDKDHAAGLAAFDRLLAQVVREKDLPSERAVQYMRCVALAETDPPAAAALAQSMITASKRAGDARDAARFQVCAGYLADRAGNKAAAQAAYEFGVAEGRRLQDAELLARALVLRGEQRATRGLYGDAIADLTQAHDLSPAASNEQRYVLNAIANLYADRRVKDYAKALPFYEKLLALHTEDGNLQGQATAHFNIASTLESLGRLGPALDSFRRALALDRQRGVADDIAFDERAVAVVLSKLGQHAPAMALLDSSIAHYRKTRDVDSEAMLQLSRGAALRRAKRFAQALPELRAAQAYYLANENPRFLEKALEELALVLGGLGDWEAAYAARGDHMQVQQQLQQLMLDERTGLLRVQFQSEQAAQQNKALGRENAFAQRELAASNTLARWQFAALALSLLAIVALALMVLRQVRLGARMRDLAMMDELTRLPNRRHFMAVAAQAFALARRDDKPLALAGLDIDHFKQINDHYGHDVGDQVLRRAAHAMRTALRPGDVIGRVGGEEFLVLMAGATLDEAAGAAERLRAAVERLDCSDIAAGLAPRISIGVSARGGAGDELEAAIKRADAAMYRAKQGGRNRVELG